MVLAECQRSLLPQRPNPYPLKMPMPKALLNWLLQNRLNHVWFGAWTHALYVCCIERFGCGVAQWQAAQKYSALALRGNTAYFEGPAVQFINLARSSKKNLDCTHIEDVHMAYRTYVAYQWLNVDARPATWTVHGSPEWFKGPDA